MSGLKYYTAIKKGSLRQTLRNTTLHLHSTTTIRSYLQLQESGPLAWKDPPSWHLEVSDAVDALLLFLLPYHRHSSYCSVFVVFVVGETISCLQFFTVETKLTSQAIQIERGVGGVKGRERDATVKKKKKKCEVLRGKRKRSRRITDAGCRTVKICMMTN